MDHPVLVTFATRFGSTEETAQAVAQALRDRGVAVELLPVKGAGALDGFGAVRSREARVSLEVHSGDAQGAGGRRA